MSQSFSISLFAEQKNSERKDTFTIQDKLRYKKSPEVFLFRKTNIQKKMNLFGFQHNSI